MALDHVKNGLETLQLYRDEQERLEKIGRWLEPMLTIVSIIGFLVWLVAFFYLVSTTS